MKEVTSYSISRGVVTTRRRKKMMRRGTLTISKTNCYRRITIILEVALEEGAEARMSSTALSSVT